MSYIGNQIGVGNFVKLDSISVTATDTFALTNGAVAYYPQSPNHCLVSLNGILQAPTDSFTISGSNIVFSSALTTNDVIDFIIVLGDVLNIGTPSDNTVSLAKLTATGTKDSTTFLRGDNTFAVPAGGTNTPAFHAGRETTGQSITQNTATEIIFNVERFDTGSFYNTSNGRFTPTTAGKYFVYSQITLENSTINTYGEIQIRKNGTTLMVGRTGGNTGYFSNWSYGIIELNGTSDYISCFFYHEDSTARNIFAQTDGIASFFGAYKIIE